MWNDAPLPLNETLLMDSNHPFHSCSTMPRQANILVHIIRLVTSRHFISRYNWSMMSIALHVTWQGLFGLELGFRGFRVTLGSRFFPGLPPPIGQGYRLHAWVSDFVHDLRLRLNV
jgi:hypothetical protein